MASMMDGFAAIFHVILGKFISGRDLSPKDHAPHVLVMRSCTVVTNIICYDYIDHRYYKVVSMH